MSADSHDQCVIRIPGYVRLVCLVELKTKCREHFVQHVAVFAHRQAGKFQIPAPSIAGSDDNGVGKGLWPEYGL